MSMNGPGSALLLQKIWHVLLNKNVQCRMDSITSLALFGVSCTYRRFDLGLHSFIQ